MGLIRAAVGSFQSTLADQYKEYFYCEAMDMDVLAVRGKKRSTKHSSNNGDDNIISNGSAIAIADGQCMLIVDQGKVIDVCAEPGLYVYDMSSQPSIFVGNLGKAISDVFKEMTQRITFGGGTASDQRVYFFNTKEITGNKYGTPNAVPFRVVDKNAGIDLDIGLRCFGEYSYRITNPILFYTNITGNFAGDYTRDQIDSQLKTELLTALQPAFAKLSEEGIRYSSLPAHAMELGDALNQVLSSKWKDLRGIEVVSFGISSLNANEDDAELIKNMQRNAAYRDPTLAAATLVGAQAQAMQDAAKNGNGAVNGFMGFNMAQNAGGVNAANLYQMGAQQAASQPAAAAPSAPAQGAADGWYCPNCGTHCTGNFCVNCGTKRP